MNQARIPKFVVYLLLILATSVPLFLGVKVPNDPTDASKAFYANLMKLKEGDQIMLASDWTGSTRGESKGHFKAVMRILMRKGVKFAMFSTADPQAPRVARDVIAEVNAERKKRGEREYVRWDDWINLGYFPNAEVALRGMADNLKGTLSSKKDFPPGKTNQESVFKSPVLAGVENVGDFKLMVVITASKTSNFTVERLYGKLPLSFAVTGVMVPETGVFFASKQIVGFLGGLKGVYDIEQLMEVDYKGQPNEGQGTLYYGTLHIALALMIVFVIIGNVEMFAAKRKK